MKVRERPWLLFLPRLTPGGIISINASIYRNHPIYVLNEFKIRTGHKPAPPLADYSNNIMDYAYSHYQPYSIIATYDQGSNQFNPQNFLVNRGLPYYPYDTNALLSLILIVLAFLSFAIALRRKRSKSVLASDILKDIMKVRDELNDKGDPSGIILRLHDWQPEH